MRLLPLLAAALAVAAPAQPGPAGRPRVQPVFEQAAHRDPPPLPERPACDEVNDSLLGAIAGGLLGQAGPRGHQGFGPGAGPLAGHGPGRGCR